MIRLKTVLLAGTATALVAAAPAMAAAADHEAASQPASAQPASTQTPSQPSSQQPPEAGTDRPSEPSSAEESSPEDSDEADEDEPAEPTAVEGIVIVAPNSEIRTSIDSVSYSLANDLQATTGSLADALRNIPSVDVDPQGNVSLRGDSNVTILVDGRPSGILSGPGRAQALLQLPASQYARIEVMTNPSAAYSPEGSGGVINLITRPTAPRAGVQTTGSARFNVGTNGRWNAGISGSWQKDRVTLSGDLSYRADPNSVGFIREREQFDPLTGDLVSITTTDQSVEIDNSGAFGRFTAEYRITPRTSLTGELRAVAFEGEGDVVGLFETRNPAGTVTSAFRRDGQTAFDFTNFGATARVVHRFDDAGHEWSNELRFDSNANESGGVTLSRFLTPAAPDLFERTSQSIEQETLGFTSAYVRPTEDGGRLRAGYELNQQRPTQDVLFERGPSVSGLAPVPGLSNRFEARQRVHAVYATFERPLSERLAAQVGLRLEQADIRIEDITGGLSASQDYFRAYPSAHVQYQLSDTQTLRASYSRRIQRPQPGQLNPFVAYQDPQNLRSGNPDLEPQETDSFELMWQMRQGQTFYQSTLYHRSTSGAFTDVAVDIGGGVLLTRPENLGGRRDTGLELTASGRISPTLRYNASVNLFYQEIDAGGIAGGSDRSGTLASGRASLNWQPDDRNFVQVTGFWQGESLLAQGTREAGGMLNIGYRRRLNDQWSLNVTGRDVLNTFNNVTVFETPLFRERFEQKVSLRAFYIGLTYSFGSSPRRQPEQFDFSTAPTGG